MEIVVAVTCYGADLRGDLAQESQDMRSSAKSLLWEKERRIGRLEIGLVGHGPVVTMVRFSHHEDLMQAYKELRLDYRHLQAVQTRIQSSL